MTRGIDVRSGVGYRTGADGTATVDMLPAEARRIGLDLIGAASTATIETAVRAWARKHGQDADGVIAWMKLGLDELLAREGEPEAPRNDRVGGDDPISA